ncbi:MAG: hypothetical protein MUE32_01665 [Bacteroidales bacterium]|nr:hypothetical protein [Bacteroidales bacterium]
MARFLFLLILTLVSAAASPQTPVGSWSDHLMYGSALSLAAGSDEIYSSTGSSILIYDKEYAELKKLSEINGLSETGISTIGWSPEQKTLVIAYTNTNIDFVSSNSVANVPDIMMKYIPGNKVINRVRCSGKYAYLASSFGIVVLDIAKKEVYDTWKPGSSSDLPEVYDVAFGNGIIYAATDEGVFRADISDPGLAYFGNWTRINSLAQPSGKFTAAIVSGDKLYVNYIDASAGGDLVYQVGASTILFSYVPGIFNLSFENTASGFSITSPDRVREYGINGSLVRTVSTYGWGTPDISQALISDGDIWIADRSAGLVRGRNFSEFIALTIPGPASNTGFSIRSSGGKTMICAGAVSSSWNNLGIPLKVSVFEGNEWNNISSSSYIDAMRAHSLSRENNRMYVTTWGYGLLEYRDNILVKQYNESNSPLQSIIPGSPFSRICGIAEDSKGNIWITQTGVPGSIKALKPDGSWIVNPVTIDAPTIGDIIITSRGHKWVVLPRGYGIFVLDDRNTPENASDDRIRKMLVKDSENQVISMVYSLTEDLEGAIWVGTDQGPLVYYNPGEVFEGDPRASRPKVPRNDGTDIYDYLLKEETVTAIAVDGANRKWIGTAGSGAYLVSADGSQLIHSFNDRNSPIFSSSVGSLAIDEKSGDVWFGTSEGIVSYRGLATKGGEEFGKVYSFPNPVREDYEGNVTITGLMRDTQVRITDVSGNLVYRTVSKGGQAEWDLKTYNGKRVATGVYIVFCASADGSQAVATKLLVIN